MFAGVARFALRLPGRVLELAGGARRAIVRANDGGDGARRAQYRHCRANSTRGARRAADAHRHRGRAAAVAKAASRPKYVEAALKLNCYYNFESTRSDEYPDDVLSTLDSHGIKVEIRQLPKRPKKLIGYGWLLEICTTELSPLKTRVRIFLVFV